MAPMVGFFCLMGMDLLVIELALLIWFPGRLVLRV